MKAKVTRISSSANNSQVTVTVQLLDDSGNLIFETTRGFVNIDADPVKALAYFKGSVKNILNQHLAENSASLKPEVEKIIGQEFTI